MPAAIADQVVEFFDDLFTRIFADASRPQTADVLRREAVLRREGEAADAARQAPIRLLRNQRPARRKS
jgi:hypothetical protein